MSQRNETSDLETIVFRVVDRKAFDEMMQHHTDQTPIYGLIPIIFASGDRVTVPGEIVEEVANMPTYIELDELSQRADQYLDSL